METMKKTLFLSLVMLMSASAFAATSHRHKKHAHHKAKHHMTKHTSAMKA